MEKGEDGMWIGGHRDCGHMDRRKVDIWTDGVWIRAERDGEQVDRWIVNMWIEREIEWRYLDM
jgi:hypothetical protein